VSVVGGPSGSAAAAHQQRQQQDRAEHEDNLCDAGCGGASQTGAAEQTCEHGNDDQDGGRALHLGRPPGWVVARRQLRRSAAIGWLGAVSAYQSGAGMGVGR